MAILEELEVVKKRRLESTEHKSSYKKNVDGEVDGEAVGVLKNDEKLLTQSQPKSALRTMPHHASHQHPPPPPPVDPFGLPWLGTCGVCLECLPDNEIKKRYMSCCSNYICRDCRDKCRVVGNDKRCPLCRGPPPTSVTENIARMKKHADNGNRLAQKGYADQLHFGGYGVERNEMGAIAYYRLSATQGYAGAQYLLGCYYYFGTQFVVRSHEKALHWWKLAAVQEHSDSQECLDLYLSGVDRDFVKTEYLTQYAFSTIFTRAVGVHQNGKTGQGVSLDQATYWWKHFSFIYNNHTHR